MDTQQEELATAISTILTQVHLGQPATEVLPDPLTLDTARNRLVRHLSSNGLGLQKTVQHLQRDLISGLNASSRSPNYYGFVTGGITPAASIADTIVTAYDQNVAVHLPNETIATDVEDTALRLLCELLDFNSEAWPHRVFTTGATASNVLGLACAREHVIAKAAACNGNGETSVGELGIVEAMRLANLEKVQVLATVPHSSLCKAAGILGLGRTSVINVGRDDSPHKFDMTRLQSMLEEPNSASIVAISASEVNTGLFATSGLEELREIRRLCDLHGAWVHVDGAFGIIGRVLDSPKYETIRQACSGLELADSITGDGHKLLNVPYDCGFFFSKYRTNAENVFLNPNAAYLATGNGPDSIASPLNIGLENSRRFRALPVYANLVAYGKSGYQDMLERQIELSRGIARFIIDNEHFELLPHSDVSSEKRLDDIFIIVLFRAKDDGLNGDLVAKIKETRQIYVSGTSWDGKPACRFAVSNWQSDVKKDLPLIKNVLGKVVDNHLAGTRG